MLWEEMLDTTMAASLRSMLCRRTEIGDSKSCEALLHYKLIKAKRKKQSKTKQKIKQKTNRNKQTEQN